ncbi:hypothetical protein QUF75_08060 [Desulfococcaceae bacterium HSG7]|nr:hypothetical protein [Desulfococcaceae bacterium HSG7]
MVNPDSTDDIPVSAADISENGDTEYQADDNLDMDESERLRLSDFSRTIEEYHCDLKQFCGIERCQCGRDAVRAYLSAPVYTF